MEARTRFIEYATMLGYNLKFWSEAESTNYGLSALHMDTNKELRLRANGLPEEKFYKNSMKDLTEHYRNVVCK